MPILEQMPFKMCIKGFILYGLSYHLVYLGFIYPHDKPWNMNPHTTYHSVAISLLPFPAPCSLGGTSGAPPFQLPRLSGAEGTWLFE